MLRCVSIATAGNSPLSQGLPTPVSVMHAMRENFRFKKSVLYAKKDRTQVARELMNANFVRLESTLPGRVLKNAYCVVLVNILI